MLGISVSTVSRALKNHPDISEKTKLRVKELAEALDYEPNTNAIHLRTRKNNLLGLIVPSVSNFFYDSFIASIEEECRKSGYTMLILQSGNDSATEEENVKLCRQNRVSGVFTCLSTQTRDLSFYDKLKTSGVPVVFFDKVPEDSNEVRVCMDDTNAAITAAKALLEGNKKKVLALFGNPSFSITRKREKAFVETISNDCQVLLHHINSLEEAKKITSAALDQKPDSIFCMSDEILTGAMKAILQAGLKIPVDIAVIAISNGFFPSLYHPDITYVETSGYKLGKLAFSTMLENIAGTSSSKEFIVETTLVKGGSL